MRKPEIEESKPKEETKPVESSPSIDSSGKLKSLSDEEYPAMVLGHAKASDRQLVEQPFQRENASPGVFGSLAKSRGLTLR